MVCRMLRSDSALINVSLQKRLQLVSPGSHLYRNWKDTIHYSPASLINPLQFTFIINPTIGKIPRRALAASPRLVSPHNYEECPV